MADSANLTIDDVYQDFTGLEGVQQAGYSGRIPFWGDAPNAWNTVILAQRKLPGIAFIDGKAFEVRADRKAVPGHTGEKLTTLGREPCDPEIVLRLWTKQHLKDFVDVVGLFLPKSSKVLPPPVDVVHPNLAIYSVKSVRIMSSSFLREVEPGVFEVKMKCREFVYAGGAQQKPKTDTASLTNLGEGEVPGEIKRKEARLSPDKTNGDAPRTKGGAPSFGKPPVGQ